MGLSIGDSVPEFQLANQYGAIFNIKFVLLKKPLVIYFYPKDNTPACTKEACMFRDSYEDFTDLGAEVIAISADSDKTHRQFAAKFELPFILLSDTENKVRKLFGVKSSIFGLLPGRETYVINQSGKVVMVFNDINATQHKHRALKALRNEIAKQ